MQSERYEEARREEKEGVKQGGGGGEAGRMGQI